MMVQQPNDIRRANFSRVVQELGGHAAVAKRCKLSGPSWVSQLILGNRVFTEKSARKFEKRLGLPYGSLDRAESFGPEDKPVIVNRDVPAVTEAFKCVELLLTRRKQTLTNTQYGALVDVVFSQALKHGEVDAELAEKILDLMV